MKTKISLQLLEFKKNAACFGAYVKHYSIFNDLFQPIRFVKIFLKIIKTFFKLFYIRDILSKRKIKEKNNGYHKGYKIYRC